MSEQNKQEPIHYVEGAFGFYHSVPESKLEEFSRQQAELEKKGRPELTPTQKQWISESLQRRRQKKS